MNDLDMEQMLGVICDVIDSVLDGRCRVIGGGLIGRVIVATVNNGYHATSSDIAQIASLLKWPCVMSIPGGVIVDGSSTITAAFVAPGNIPPPYINSRLALAAKQP